MKNLENMKKLNEEEVEKVAGGLPYIIPHHFPITQPSEPEERRSQSLNRVLWASR